MHKFCACLLSFFSLAIPREAPDPKNSLINRAIELPVLNNKNISGDDFLKEFHSFEFSFSK